MCIEYLLNWACSLLQHPADEDGDPLCSSPMDGSPDHPQQDVQQSEYAFWLCSVFQRDISDYFYLLSNGIQKDIHVCK